MLRSPKSSLCRLSLSVVVAGATLFSSLVVESRSASAASPSPVGPLQALEIGPRIGEGKLSLRGRDARLQLIVTGDHGQGTLKDYTRTSGFSVQPEGIITIDETGLVKPLNDGEVTITATVDGKQAQSIVTVTDFHNQVPINFKNQIVPIFTKLGCNSGGCHGKASGQNGFKLSLLGFYADEDYEFLVKESRGRRIFPTAPERSLLLTKPVGESPHGGGKRMERDSYEYRMIARWIEQGMPYGNADDPEVASIECLPRVRVMGQNAEQQVAVYATYTDGSREDVTRMALFEPNDTELAESDVTGLVKTLDLAGEVAVMARYQGQVSTFRATIPLGAEITHLPAKRNYIDEAVFGKLEILGIPPSELCDDATFVRRVYIDITGKLPTAEQSQAFLDDTNPSKRDALIDHLVDTREYADYFTNKWNFVLRNKKQANDDLGGTYAFHQWIWNSLYENKPYDQFVREIITASGDSSFNPPVVWYRQVTQTNEQVEDVAQLFLGVRIQCARCHHHPFEKWSQNDYYSFSAFFSQVGRKNLAAGEATQRREKRIFHNGEGNAKNS
ncbi:MAG: DUF1549 domain-containing protein [Planctomycetaceae bacterium]